MRYTVWESCELTLSHRSKVGVGATAIIANCPVQHRVDFVQHVLDPDRVHAPVVPATAAPLVGRTNAGGTRQRLIERARLAQRQVKERSFRADPKAAEALIQVGQAPKPADLEARRLAVWMTLASVLFNLDETLTKG